MNLTNFNKVNICFYALYALYAVITLSIFGYGVYFLESFGFSYIEIGMTTGLAALISSLIQPLIGRLADIRQYSWKNILIILAGLMLIASVAILFAPKSMIIFLFGFIVIELGCVYPFLNAGVFYYESYGIETDFGISRGFGSLTYMIVAALLGFMLSDNDIMIINWYSVIASIIMLLVLLSLPYYGGIASKESKPKKSKSNVLIKYPVFGLIFISVTLFMIFHNVYMSYMISIFENVGGNITDVGVANSLGALLELPTMFLFYKLLRRFSAKQLIIIASICYVARSLMIFAATDPMGIYLSLILHTLTFAIIIPASVHITDEIMSDEDKYEGQAFMGSTLTIGVIFANFLGGTILQMYGVNLLLIILVAITAAGCLFALATTFLDRD